MDENVSEFCVLVVSRMNDHGHVPEVFVENAKIAN